MSQQPASTDKQDEAVRRCFAAYGGDVGAWPADKRTAFGDLALSDAFAAERDDALSLDAFLNTATARAPRHDLKNRIMAGIDLSRDNARAGAPGLLAMLLRPLPAGALAGLGALGLATGFVTANAQVASPPEYEAYAYLEDAGTLISEEEAVQWDED
ncbi:MAG: hypothetical protein AAF936_06315 [Pseudomonadota bacterium]